MRQLTNIRQLRRWLAGAGVMGLALLIVAHVAALTSQVLAQQAPTASPIEQFQLEGPYLILSRENTARGLSNQPDSRPDMEQASGDNANGLWEFIAVENSNYVRIRNVPKQTFLQNRRGELATSPTSAQGDGTQWEIAAVEGQPYVTFISRADGLTLARAEGKALLTSSPRSAAAAQWSLTSSSDFLSNVARKGSPVRLINDNGRNDAYLAAIRDCREIGGYWTGGSCRGIEGRRLECRRGWIWSADAGECVWDGGGRLCPPWQVGAFPYCQADMACRGGNLRVTHAGYAVCDCPYGSALRGSYPNFRCGSAVGISPIWLVPVIAGVAIGTLPKILPIVKPLPIVAPPKPGSCPPGQVWNGNTKTCGPVNIPIKAPTCSQNQHLVNNVCVNNKPVTPPLVCPSGMHAFHGKCIPIKKKGGGIPPTCSNTQHLVNNVCVNNKPTKPTLVCQSGTHPFHGNCIPNKKTRPITHPKPLPKACPVGTHLVGRGTCVANKCVAPHKMVNGKCV